MISLFHIVAVRRDPSIGHSLTSHSLIHYLSILFLSFPQCRILQNTKRVGKEERESGTEGQPRREKWLVSE